MGTHGARVSSEKNQKGKTFWIFGFLILFFAQNAFSWGPIGHRVVAQIAQNHLTTNTKKELQKILRKNTLVELSTWPDFIRSDKSWDQFRTWHYVNIEDDQDYLTMNKNPEGDVIRAILICEDLLRDKNISRTNAWVVLSYLVHMMGDIHQPLHAGKASDRGANDVEVKWFGEKTNLHEVWDEHLINFQKLSYTEYAHLLDRVEVKEKSEWEKSTVLDWANESKKLRAMTYEIPNDAKLKYDYNFQHIKTVNQRLQMAGIRLAHLLNKIFMKAPLTKDEIKLRENIFKESFTNGTYKEISFPVLTLI